MEIKKAVYKTSFATLDKYKEYASACSVAEICLTGRSNVGKSSFINSLTNQSKLARTSSSPGRTRLINLFEINDGEFVFTDLPGYGYAEASKDARKSWGELIEGYLMESKNLKHVFSLTDIRHEPTKQDVQMLHYLYHYSLPFTVIAAKSDKLSKAEIGRAVQKSASTLKLGKDNVIAYSSVSGYGKDAVLQRLSDVLSAQSE